MNGIVCLWSGSIAEIPPGWHLCDGLAGTPDLRDRFIIGSGGTFAVGATHPTNMVSDSGIAYFSLAYIMKL